jgi:flagellum-specific ATP synthase|tara:strand:+ start:675 stop:1994 length:1320 start_codon:yes stop_codon:yes gene_type:complete
MSFQKNLIANISEIKRQKAIVSSGRVNRFDGNVLYCDPFPAPIGSLCLVKDQLSKNILAEVISFDQNHNMLAILEHSSHIVAGCEVTLFDDGRYINVDETLLGRVTDAFGKPLDDKPNLDIHKKWPLMGKSMNPLKRSLIKKPLDVGVRIINALLTVGRGQRLGIIAGSGVGKSILLGMMSKYTEADIVVVALIGERAREVGSMVNELFNNDTSNKITVVAVPADRSPLMRIRAANRATAIAEYFRDQNKNVLLIMDSLTRIAHAKREIGLSLGEATTSKGYPASVISMIPNLIERTGTSDNGEGSITAFYTILADGDDNNDPVVDTARAILDGHIVLSRLNAQMGIYPAVDISLSISRVMNDLISDEHSDCSKHFRKHITTYLENKDLLLMGGYNPGQDKDLDDAIRMWPKIIDFISQPSKQKASYEESVSELLKLYK